jgi:hypothetical protein
VCAHALEHLSPIRFRSGKSGKEAAERCRRAIARAMRCGTGQIEHGLDLCVVQWSYPELAGYCSDQLRSRIDHQRTSSRVCAKDRTRFSDLPRGRD